MSIPKVAQRELFVIACVTAFAWIFSYAWVTEDAFITFRVIGNLLHGYGLRWNIDERVQVYTHPLWMLLHIPFYAVFGHIYYVTIGLSVVCGFGAAGFLMASRQAHSLPRSVLVLLPMAASTTFCIYIICGLEAPLQLCLLGWFLYECLQAPPRIYRLALIAALCVLVRFDIIFALAPFLAWLAVTQRSKWRLTPLLAATAPLWIWCGFCLLYYGFVFPNTKYAKLNTGLPLADYIAQGLHYLQSMLYFDMVGFAWIAAALLVALAGLLARRKRESERMVLLAGAAIALQLAYVIAIGGDYMAGRFLIVPFYLSLWLIYAAGSQWSGRRLAVIIAAVVLLVLAENVALPPGWHNNINISSQHGIVNERSYYASTNTVFSSGRARADIDWDNGWKQRGRLFVIEYNIDGMFGFRGGPQMTIIDNFAITDPLLARLPANVSGYWRIGHFERTLPPGYLYARQTGDDSRMPEPLRRYYEKLRLVTSGNLFDIERLKAILGFHLGWYDSWREAYLHPSLTPDQMHSREH